jgi:proteic killer suppression protein
MCDLTCVALRVAVEDDPVVPSQGLKRLYEEDDQRGINTEHAVKLRDILARLDAAASVEDMDLPGFRLHALKRDLKGHWAVAVRAN